MFYFFYICSSHDRDRVFVLFSLYPYTSIFSPPPMNSIQVVHEFMDVFLVDFPSIPLDHDIDLAINVELGHQAHFYFYL